MRKLCLLLFCLLTHLTASSQAAAPLVPLRPLVVSLDSGQTLRRPLIGIDTAFYRAVRLKVNRAELLEYGRTLDAAQVQQLQAELRRCRGQITAAGEDFAHLAAVTKQMEVQPVARSLLLDPHSYQGAAGGMLLLLLAKLYFHL